MLRASLIAASRSRRLRGIAERSALVGRVVVRRGAGKDEPRAGATVRGLARERLVTLDLLGEDARDGRQAEQTAEAYEHLRARLAGEGLPDRVEVSVKLSALGQALG